MTALFHRFLPLLVIFLGLLVQTTTSFAQEEARIDIGSRRMAVKTGGEGAPAWMVSGTRRVPMIPRGSGNPIRPYLS